MSERWGRRIRFAAAVVAPAAVVAGVVMLLHRTPWVAAAGIVLATAGLAEIAAFVRRSTRGQTEAELSREQVVERGRRAIAAARLPAEVEHLTQQRWLLGVGVPGAVEGMPNVDVQNGPLPPLPPGWPPPAPEPQEPAYRMKPFGTGRHAADTADTASQPRIAVYPPAAPEDRLAETRRAAHRAAHPAERGGS